LNQHIIQNNLLEIKDRIARAARRAGRKPEEIKIVAVTKTHPADVVLLAYRAGLWIFGENRIQEATPKIETLSEYPEITWHLIGHLQSNKARKAVEYFDLIQAVDSAELAERLAGIGREKEQKIPILLEVNVSREATKYGLSPQDLSPVLDKIASLPEIEIQGLMTIGPLAGTDMQIHRAFAELRKIFEKTAAIVAERRRFDILSMGMTDDFEIAIEEGANMIRIGRGIFGERAPI